MVETISYQVAHINLGNARAANLQLDADLAASNYLLCSVNEPYTLDDKVVYFSGKYHIIQ